MSAVPVIHAPTICIRPGTMPVRADTTNVVTGNTICVSASVVKIQRFNNIEPSTESATPGNSCSFLTTTLFG